MVLSARSGKPLCHAEARCNTPGTTPRKFCPVLGRDESRSPAYHWGKGIKILFPSIEQSVCGFSFIVRTNPTSCTTALCTWSRCLKVYLSAISKFIMEIRYRSANTGRFVKPWVNRLHPETTIRDVMQTKTTRRA